MAGSIEPMSATGYKLLGFVVWQGGKWYLRRRLPSRAGDRSGRRRRVSALARGRRRGAPRGRLSAAPELAATPRRPVRSVACRM